MHRIYKPILHSDERDFKILVKSGMFQRNFTAHFRELSEDEGGITCKILSFNYTVLLKGLSSVVFINTAHQVWYIHLFCDFFATKGSPFQKVFQEENLLGTIYIIVFHRSLLCHNMYRL